MRHSWKKEIEGWLRVKKPHRIGYRIIKVDEIKECEYCGLLKGVQKSRGGYHNWHTLIYFDQDSNFLSQEKLPYYCTGKQDVFLTKADFEIC